MRTLAARTIGAIVAVPAAVAVLSAQSPRPQTPAQVPVFRAAVDRVAVDFVAVNSDGQPIPNLEAGEITLKVDGKPRDITSLELVRLVPAMPAPESSLPPAVAVPAPFGSNAPSEAGRAFLLVFHHTSMKPGDERFAKAAATTFIKGLRPRDRVALITFREGGVLADLTTDHAKVLKALSTVLGHAPASSDFIPAQTAAAAASETAYAVRELIGMMGSFEKIDGPKTVVFVSTKLPDLSRDNMYDYQEIGKAAAKARVQLYVLQAHTLGAMDVDVNHPIMGGDGFSANGPTSAVGGGLRDFAGVTGGVVMQLSSAATTAFERINSESTAYYLLSFDARSSERDGKTHKISLSISRPNVTVRARPEFHIPKATPPAPSATQTRTLLKNLQAYRDVPLRAVAYSYRGEEGKAKVIVAAESTNGMKITAASYALIDGNGRSAAAWDADAGDLAMTPVISAMEVPSGTYRLRVAAMAEDGRMGAVDYEFRTNVTVAGPLTSGDLMLGQMREAAFAPQITFSDEPEATAYLEVYGRPAEGQKATVTVELAPAADSPAKLSVPAEISPTSDADRWIAIAKLPLGSLPPGDHVIRAVIRIGDTTGTVVRTLRKR
jgi:VWFA-related protein